MHKTNSELNAVGRLLNQVADQPTTVNGQASLLTKQASLKSSLVQFSTQKWFIVTGVVLCGVLCATILGQWAIEFFAWRRRCRKQEQDAACRSHVEAYADIESPSKLAAPNSFKGEFASNHIETSSPVREGAPSNPGGGANGLLRLPPSVLVRRTPSIRNDHMNKDLSNGSPTVQSPRSSGITVSMPHSPGSTRFRAGPLRRTGSSSKGGKLQSSLLCETPPSPKMSELTVDASVKLRDASAMGWALNPHGRCSSSMPGTPTTPTSEACSPMVARYDLRHGKLFFNSGSKHRLAQAGLEPKPLTRLKTEAGFLDFKLTTSIADDVDYLDNYDELIQDISTNADTITATAGTDGDASAQTRLEKALSTAKSIKPRDVTDWNEDHGINPYPRDYDRVPEPSPARVTPPPAALYILSPDEFAEQVTLLFLLGAGGAGSVHEAMWRGKRVAVKILHPSRQVSASADSFRREIDLMASVGTHPGIITILAACITPPYLAIVTELAVGGSLHAALHENCVRPKYGTLLQMAEDIAAAMVFCHSKKLVHRDLKTHNVLLDVNGRIKIADFGLAASRNRTFLTVEHGALGTASVMAPEQFAAHEVTEKCDSYAFGCLLWEMLTGRQAWEDFNIMQIVMAVACQRQRLPLPPECPASLARLIRECWRHNAALRPGFDEILGRIRRILREDVAAKAIEAIQKDTEPAAAQTLGGLDGLFMYRKGRVAASSMKSVNL